MQFLQQKHLPLKNYQQKHLPLKKHQQKHLLLKKHQLPLLMQISPSKGVKNYDDSLSTKKKILSFYSRKNN
jgi:hypothetical protein